MVLLTGANGQLGQDFQKLFTNLGVDFIATDYNELDVTDATSLSKFVEGKAIDYIINCAAYNDVDMAERESERAFSLNFKAVENLSKIAEEIDAVFVTFSTDFVFDGNSKIPYTESDRPNPISVYADSKLRGESAAFDNCSKCFTIRTSWVFGMGNNNFNKQVISWSNSRDVLNIVDDQISSPTYSWDLAEYSWALIQSKNYGLYHLSNSGECSKYEQAKYVLEQIKWEGKIGTAKTADFNLLAKRSEYSKLDSSKAEAIIGKKMPSWQSGIDRFLKEYNKG